jgi:Methyltransferase domain
MPSELAVHPHRPAERAELFSAHDGGSTELEYLELLRALVGVTKPSLVLETGAWRGFGTYSLAQAVEANGFGQVMSLESDHARVYEVRARLATAKLERWARVIETDSRTWLTAQDPQNVELAFFDSGGLDVRLEELELAVTLGWLASGNWFVIHDTSRLRTCDDTGTPNPLTAAFWQRFGWLADTVPFHYLEFPLSRGLVVGRIG